jgi:hypothetical protein
VKNISQSTVLVGVLLAGFVVWLLMNKKLAAYWAILTGATAGSTANPTATAGQPGSASASAPGTPGAAGQGTGTGSSPGPLILTVPGQMGASPPGTTPMSGGTNAAPLNFLVPPVANPLGGNNLFQGF